MYYKNHIYLDKAISFQEPIIEPGNSFQYSSLVSLRSGAGHMWGTYLMERRDGRFINVTIPPFMLLSQNKEYTPPSPSPPIHRPPRNNPKSDP